MKHPNHAIEELLNNLTSYKLAKIDLSLSRVQQLLTALGNPQEKLPNVIHIAGTNGKGSLLAYLTSICESAGYKVNRLTSPFLVRFNEEIYLSGKNISDEYLLELLKKISVYADKNPVTFFEATTALAFLAFTENTADITLLETGLGGRLDATNTISSPVLTAITPVSIDHSEFLGNTLTAIAGEKAGIIKNNVPCVVGKQEQEVLNILTSTAKKCNAPLYRQGVEWNTREQGKGFFYNSDSRQASFPLPSLAGAHQVFNAATAIACIDNLQWLHITNDHISSGIIHASWPARLQQIIQGYYANLIPRGSELWLDGAHNPGAGEVLANWLKTKRKPIHLICGVVKNKDARNILSPLASCTKSLTAIPIINEKHPGHTPYELAEIARNLGISASTSPTAEAAIKSIISEEKSACIILICGSLYLAGNILQQNDAA